MLGEDLIPWLCWILPTIGGALALLFDRINRTLRDLTATTLALMGWIMAILMLPDLFAIRMMDKRVFWITLPGGASVGMGMLVDPLSVILANVVAFLGFITLVYSIKYMEDEPGQGRFWFFMSIFIGSMLLLVLADNLILFFIGWKIVGLCSYFLIGHYYSDERKYWIGGPEPHEFQRPSRCGLKALLVTTFGDVSLLAGIIILYVYSGTFNFIDLYRTAGIWFRSMAANPGTIMLLSILMLGGPISKSAQFPLHEWLPEAMAGPTPVSALIHAATMVKAGVYFAARILPLFFYAYWMLNYSEASVFFTLTAAIGAFTAFLAGTQAMVSLELKKALAYSTMSQISYMMLALGVSGLNADTLALGVSAGIFHLISHGIFKAALFLCAGVLIHVSSSIYMHGMGIDRRNMPLTWLFMWIASLSLIGVPPLSGFWSKDEILVSCLESGQPLIFTVALITVAITSFYTTRMMGMTFHSGERHSENKRLEASLLMLIPYGLLAALTVILGLMGPWIGNFLKGTFHRYYTEYYGLAFSDTVSRGIHGDVMSIIIPAVSILMIAVGFVPAHKLYVSRRLKPEEILRRHVFLHKLHGFLWNRWYIDPFYNRVFVRGMLRLRRPIVKFVENPIDFTLNIGVPTFFIFASRWLRRVQTGMLSMNMLYLLTFSAVIFIVLRLVVP